MDDDFNDGDKRDIIEGIWRQYVVWFSLLRGKYGGGWWNCCVGMMHGRAKEDNICTENIYCFDTIGGCHILLSTAHRILPSRVRRGNIYFQFYSSLVWIDELKGGALNWSKLHFLFERNHCYYWHKYSLLYGQREIERVTLMVTTDSISTWLYHLWKTRKWFSNSVRPGRGCSGWLAEGRSGLCKIYTLTCGQEGGGQPASQPLASKKNGTM